MMQDGFVLKWKIESEMSDMEMERTGVSGYAETPDFGGDYNEELYKGGMTNTLIVQLPDDLEEKLDKGRLVVDLQVNTGEGKGWMETVRYTAGQSLKYFSTRKTWEEAEKECSENGGHLASVISQQENDDFRSCRRGNCLVGRI